MRVGRLSPRTRKILAISALAYAACWATTLIFGPSTVRKHLPHELPGLDFSKPLPIVEEFAAPNVDDPTTVPDHLRSRDWVFVGRVRCWAPFLITADLAAGGRGYAAADRYHVLWLPGFTRTVGREFFWQAEW